MLMGAMRLGPLKPIDYDVLIHVDRVHNYSPLHDNLEHRSIVSDISDIPDDELKEERLVKHRYVWSLGVLDRWPSPERRVPVHERLGTGRDRSPLRGGGAGGRGFRQMPLSGRYDQSPSFFRGSSSGAGGGNDWRSYGGGNGGGHFHGITKGNVFDRLGGGRACVPVGNVFDRLSGDGLAMPRRSADAAG